jgi:elongation factor G
MKDFDAGKTRNVAVVGHGSCGKTTLAAAFLFDTGATSRLAQVDKGNTVTDYDPDEIERQISINSALCHLEWNGHKINLIDCPGYTNFLWDTRASLRAVDAGIVVVSAAGGVEVGTEKVWEMMADLEIPGIFVVNKLDRENADFEGTVGSIHEFFGRQAIPVQMPIGKEAGFTGVVDLIKQKAIVFEKDGSGKFKEEDIPDNLKDAAKKKIEELTEMVAENDEALMEKYFENGELSPQELISGFKKSVLERQIFPIFCASGGSNIGAQTILDGIVNFLPDPVQKGEIVHEGGTVKLSADQPFSALVFKTISDPYTGRISIMRVFSGRVNPDASVENISRQGMEKLGGLFFLQGKEQIPAGQAKAGDLVATAKLKDTGTGDTLCEKSGNGQLHVEVITNRLRKRFNVDVDLKPPKISYKETIKGRSDVQAKFKKQTGGRGQYADVRVKFDPLPRGEEFLFENTVFGGAIPKNYIPSVEKGVQEARKKGVLAGYPTVGFKANLYDGTFHEVDSSDIAFKVAATMAFKKGIKEARPTILEPIMTVETYTPDTYMGDIMGTLNGRRGKVQGMEQKGSMRIIKAQVPLAEMLDYEPMLTSITGGRGSFLMEFSHYEEVPAHLQQKIIEGSIKEGRIRPSEEDEK